MTENKRQRPSIIPLGARRDMWWELHKTYLWSFENRANGEVFPKYGRSGKVGNLIQLAGDSRNL